MLCYNISRPHVYCFKSYVHIGSLDFRHFGMAEATGLNVRLQNHI
jgi:hypothetical protein